MNVVFNYLLSCFKEAIMHIIPICLSKQHLTVCFVVSVYFGALPLAVRCLLIPFPLPFLHLLINIFHAAYVLNLLIPLTLRLNLLTTIIVPF